MSGLAFMVAALPVAIMLWLLVALARELGQRIVERAAAWILPDTQAITFRVAWLIASAARAIAPSGRKVYSRTPGGFIHLMREIWASNGSIDLEFTGWWWVDPEAALAELEADLSAGTRYAQPVRLTAPLLVIAVRMRLANLFAVARFDSLGWLILCPLLVVHALSLLTKSKSRPDREARGPQRR
jgi:hypothetical protein